MVTVLHEIDKKEWIVNGINRILKDSGRVMIIDFYCNNKLIWLDIVQPKFKIEIHLSEAKTLIDGFYTFVYSGIGLK